MNVLQKAANWLKTKALSNFISLTSSSEFYASWIGGAFEYGQSSSDFLKLAYGANPYTFMVVHRIASRLIQIDRILLDKNGKAIEDPKFMELFNKPNSKEDSDTLIYRAVATYLVAGEFFLVRESTVGEPDQYFVPVNYQVTINQDIKGEILSYTISRFGVTKIYLPFEVLHVHIPDITRDSNYGNSQLRAGRKVWESNNEVWKSEAAIHKNKGISGVLYADGNRPALPSEQDDLQKEYDSRYTGAQAFGKVRVSTQKLGYIPMGMNPTDLQSIQSRLDHLRAICAIYNVDSKLFNDPAASTYNNMPGAARGFIVNAVIPTADTILPQMVSFMSKSVFRQLSMKLNEDEIVELGLSRAEKSVRLGREIRDGIITQEEARSILYPNGVK